MNHHPNYSQLILADGHVHLHNFFDLAQVLDRAWDNFQKVAAQKFKQEKLTALLFLTEMARQDKFEQLKHKLESQKNVQFGNWRIERTKEKESLIAHQPDSHKKIILQHFSRMLQECP